MSRDPFPFLTWNSLDNCLGEICGALRVGFNLAEQSCGDELLLYTPSWLAFVVAMWRYFSARLRWYTRVWQRLVVLHCAAEYASVFGKYAECLVSALQKLVETRRSPSYASKAAEGCGCSCSICVGQPCRIRLAWRQHLMAFELAIDKTAAARSRSGEQTARVAQAYVGKFTLLHRL